MRAVLSLAFALLLLPLWAARGGGAGLNLDRPKFIDAAAAVLFASARPEDYDRVSDDAVKVNITGRFDRELRRMSNKTCAVQLVDTSQGTFVYGQFEFSRLSANYTTAPTEMGGIRIRLLGDSIYCSKGRDGTTCRSEYDVYTGGTNAARTVVKALDFIAAYHCPRVF